VAVGEKERYKLSEVERETGFSASKFEVQLE
jgi:hypothetical protein